MRGELGKVSFCSWTASIPARFELSRHGGERFLGEVGSGNAIQILARSTCLIRWPDAFGLKARDRSPKAQVDRIAPFASGGARAGIGKPFAPVSGRRHKRKNLAPAKPHRLARPAIQ